MPISPIDIMDHNKPNAREVLGRKVVAWYDSTKDEWSVLDDQCPHRLASLSLGAVTEGSIRCRYHGWSFGSDGSCTDIPWESGNSAASNPRACAAKLPSKVVAGLLFVWPDPSESRFIDCLATDPVIPKELLDAKNMKWTFNVEPMDYVAMMENNMDPSHAMFTHEGTLPSYKPKFAKPMSTFEVSPEGVTKGGFTLLHNEYNTVSNLEATREFIGPTLSSVRYSFSSGFDMGFHFYFVPSSPGFTMVLSSIKVKPAEGSPALPRLALGGFNRITSLVGKVFPALSHMSQFSTLSFQDISIINPSAQYQQERELQGESLQSMNFLPTSADRGITTYRRWLINYAGGRIGWLSRNRLIPELSEERALSQWHRHTKHCRHCRKALRQLQSFSRFLQFGQTVALVSVAMTAAARLSALTAASLCFAGVLTLMRHGTDSYARRMVSALPENSQEVDLRYPDAKRR
ncbi:unnamed protein product [Chrysoparadoxa australica]